MPKHGKRYRALLEKIDPNKVYSIEEAAKLIPEIKSARFDETVEAHIKLGIDARKSDQNVRSTVALPHGTGRSVRVLAIAKGDKIIEARDAGADIAAGEEIIPEILAGRSDFDAVVATPDVMGAVGSKLGRVLGPRGLLPNPKAGTVGFNIAEIVREIKAGRIEVRSRWGFSDEGKATVREDSDLHRHDGIAHVGRSCVELLDELHDVRAVLTQSRADRRRGCSFPSWKLEFDDGVDLFHFFSLWLPLNSRCYRLGTLCC